MKRLIFLLCIIFSACQSDRIFETYQSIPQAEWRSNNILKFQSDIRDTSVQCNVLINIRHKGNYPYSNLYLFVAISSPSHQIVRDTIQVFLSDAGGKWYGSGGLGDLYLLQKMYKKNIRFGEKGLYNFYIEQAMRMRKLPGITDIGLRIEKAK